MWDTRTRPIPSTIFPAPPFPITSTLEVIYHVYDNKNLHYYNVEDQHLYHSHPLHVLLNYVNYRANSPTYPGLLSLLSRSFLPVRFSKLFFSFIFLFILFIFYLYFLILNYFSLFFFSCLIVFFIFEREREITENHKSYPTQPPQP